MSFEEIMSQMKKKCQATAVKMAKAELSCYNNPEFPYFNSEVEATTGEPVSVRIAELKRVINS